jgi:hypothetical protein
MKQGCASWIKHSFNALLVRGGHLTAILLGLGAMNFLSAADTPKDSPQEPAHQRVPEAARRRIGEWFSGLSDDDPLVREEAMRKLLTMTRQDLPALREVVKERRPLMPGEADALRVIVTHVYLSEDPYDRNEQTGFVGVLFDEEQEYDELPMGGVEVRRRLPGFCASRFLEDGDVILSVGDPPSEILRSSQKMTQEIMRNSAGKRLTFLVLRRGRLMQIPVVLDAKPADLHPAGVPIFMAERQATADQYWEAEFEALVEDGER